MGIVEVRGLLFTTRPMVTHDPPPHGVENQHGGYNSSAEYPVIAFDPHINEKRDHDRVKGKGQEEAPHGDQGRLQPSSSRGKIKSTSFQLDGDNQCPSFILDRTVQAPVG